MTLSRLMFRAWQEHLRSRLSKRCEKLLTSRYCVFDSSYGSGDAPAAACSYHSAFRRVEQDTILILATTTLDEEKLSFCFADKLPNKIDICTTIR